MKILNQINGGSYPTTYEDGFRRLIEDHLGILQNSVLTKVIEITPTTALRNEGIFYNLLQEIGYVDISMHWVIMRLNSMIDPSEYTKDRLQLLVPDTNEITRYINIYKTSKKGQ